MKVNELEKIHGFERNEFVHYLRKIQADVEYNFIGDMIIENNIEEHVNNFKKYLKEKELELSKIKIERERAEEERARAEEKKSLAMSNMLITSGFNFDGYKIVKYSGYISGDDAISITRGRDGLFSSVTDVSSSLTDSLVIIRRRAIQELKEAAYELGCNAVIGVDFDYITLEPETVSSTGGTLYLPYVFCVTANGNAVIIEKEEQN